jgi:hypothetical protein
MEGALKAIQEYRKKYMELYIQGQALFAEYNPCEPHEDGTCLRTRRDPHYESKPGDRCCSNCKFHTPSEGCHTIALSCKLWVCGMITSMAFSDKYPRLREFHGKLHTLQHQMGELHPYPSCREPMFESLDTLRRHVAKYIINKKSIENERSIEEYEAAKQRWQEETQTKRYQAKRA